MNAMPTDNAPQPAASPSRIRTVVFVYTVFASFWILLSDTWLQMIYSNPSDIILASLLKGWLFVGVTSLLLYVLMRRWLGGNGAPPTKVPHPLRLGWPFAALAALIVALTCTAILNTFIGHKKTENARLQAIADLKTRQIADWFRERQGDADFIHTSDFLAELYQRWQASGDIHSGEQLQARLEQFRKIRRFSAATLLSPQGIRLWSSDPATLPPNAVAASHSLPIPLTKPRGEAEADKQASTHPEDAQATAALAATDRKVRRMDPYLDAAGGICMDFVVPLSGVPGPAPTVILHIDLADWLLPTLQNWPVPSASGETVLFRQQGDSVFYLNNRRQPQDMAANLSLPVATKELLASQALRGEVLQGKLIEGVDYRGIPSIGVARTIADTDWYLLAKLDRAELYAEVAEEASWISLIGGLVLLIAAAGVYLSRQERQLAQSQSLQQAQAELLRSMRLLASIADSSDDAIFAKDMEGHFILFNQAACRFVGKPAEAILGRDDLAIFPKDQAEMLIAIGRQVIAENRIQTLEEVLSTAQGERIFLATKGPLCDVDGTIIGLFGISRDITERKRAEEAIQQQSGELTQRNAELERFNRAMVGRELDMVALKQLVNALSRQLGQEPPYPLAFLAEPTQGDDVVELTLHADRDRRYPDCRDALEPCRPWSLGSGGPCRNGEESINSTALPPGEEP